MSIVVKELVESRSVSFSNGAYRQANREFLVYETTGNELDVEEILPQSDIPDVGYMEVQGEQHPSLPLMTAQEANITAISGKKNAFRVSIVYKRMYVSGPDSNRPGYMEFSSSITSEFREVWRRLPSQPDDVNAPDDEDIGGSPIDVKGEPVSVTFSTATIQVQHVIEGNFPFSIIQSLAGKRNESQWSLFAPGTVLFEGTGCATVSVGVRRLTHTFHHDPMYHLRQVSVPDFASGTAINSGIEASYALSGYPIFFRQPFPDVADFSLLGVDEVLVVE